MTYQQWVTEERHKIAAMRSLYLGVGQIARRIGRHRSTLYRELKRNASAHHGIYRALPGSAGATRTPMACCGSICPKARTWRDSPNRSAIAPPRSSTTGPASASDTAPQTRSITHVPLSHFNVESIVEDESMYSLHKPSGGRSHNQALDRPSFVRSRSYAMSKL